MTVAFIVGAGRSGSTLLYKLLCMHPDVGYISNYMNSLPGTLPSGYVNRLFRDAIETKRWAWFEKTGNAYGIHRSFMKRIVPLPVEGENVYRRCGLPLFPAPDYAMPEETGLAVRRYFERLQRQSGTDVFISKRVANSRRIRYLHQAFPDARFINLVRDGRAVAYSLLNVSWWNEDSYVWWANDTIRNLVQHGYTPLQIAARGWLEVTNLVSTSLGGIDHDQVLNLSYEDLLTHPYQEIERILHFLGVDENAEFQRNVESVGLLPDREAWREGWTEEEISLVESIQAEGLNKHGYQI